MSLWLSSTWTFVYLLWIFLRALKFVHMPMFCGVTYKQLYTPEKHLHSPSVSMDQVWNHWRNLCIIHGWIWNSICRAVYFSISAWNGTKYLCYHHCENGHYRMIQMTSAEEEAILFYERLWQKICYPFIIACTDKLCTICIV